MPRFQILALAIAWTTPNAWAICRIRAVGHIRFTDAQPTLFSFEKSLGETQLKILPAAGTDRSEILLYLLSMNGRYAAVTGTCTRPPQLRRGEVITDLSGIKLTLPDAFKANDGDEVIVESE